MYNTRAGSLIWRVLGKLDMWAHTHIACMGCNNIAYVYRSKMNMSVLLVGVLAYKKYHWDFKTWTFKSIFIEELPVALGLYFFWALGHRTHGHAPSRACTTHEEKTEGKQTKQTTYTQVCNERKLHYAMRF
jgi:hypothetical protein